MTPAQGRPRGQQQHRNLALPLTTNELSYS